MKRMIHLLISMIFIFGLVGCAKPQDTSIYSCKTPYIGDNANVSKIVREQGYPKDAKVDHIQIISAQQPYQLIVYLENTDLLDSKDLFENAVMSFSLIGNADELVYKSGDHVIATFNKEDVNEELHQNNQKSIEQIGESEDSFNQYFSK